MRRTILHTLALAAIIGAPPRAVADKGWNRPLTVTMSRASAEYDKQGRLVWSYQVDHRSWSMLQEKGVPAFVDAYTVYMEHGKERRIFRYRTRLQKHGTAWLNPNALEGWQAADFQINGAMADYWIEGMIINGEMKRYSRWNLKESRSTPPATGAPSTAQPGATYVDIVQACHKHFVFDRNRSSCIEIGKQLRPREALETIRACSASSPFARKKIECLQRAPRHQGRKHR